MGEQAQWFRGNLHMHSFWSDGLDFPEMVAYWYKSHGYQFIAFTEHDRHQTGEKWVRCDPKDWQGGPLIEGDLLKKYVARFGDDWVEQRTRDGLTEVRLKPASEYRHRFEEPGRFLIINGEEVTTSWGGAGRDQQHWINVLNTPEPIPPQHSPGASLDGMKLTFDAAEAIEQGNGRKVLAFLNHPNFRWNATAETIAALPNLRHMEIHTALNSAWTYGDATHPSAERIWDIALTKRLGELGGDIIYGLAMDDSHDYAHRVVKDDNALPGRAWIMVRSPRLAPDDIIAAIQQGDFYASTGVSLADFHADKSGIRLRIEPVGDATYRTQFIGTRKGRASTSAEVGCVLAEANGTTASYQIAGDELYVRAVVVSDIPHPSPTIPGETCKAWTQPVRSP